MRSGCLVSAAVVLLTLSNLITGCSRSVGEFGTYDEARRYERVLDSIGVEAVVGGADESWLLRVPRQAVERANTVIERMEQTEVSAPLRLPLLPSSTARGYAEVAAAETQIEMALMSERGVIAAAVRPVRADMLDVQVWLSESPEFDAKVAAQVVRQSVDRRMKVDVTSHSILEHLPEERAVVGPFVVLPVNRARTLRLSVLAGVLVMLVGLGLYAYPTGART